MFEMGTASKVVRKSRGAQDRRIVERRALAQKLYKEGLTNQQIAIQLGVSESTVSRDLKEQLETAR